jgi:hypothetical protein
MNASAVALAADSATTVTNWENGQQQHRYFKGANKIFQLSDVHPVGMMIHGAASLHNVPWELIAKDFRKYLGSSSKDSVSAYGDQLQEYLGNNRRFWPDEARLALDNYNLMVGTVAVWFNAVHDEHYKQIDNDEARREWLRTRITAVSNQASQVLEAQGFAFSQADADDAIRRHSAYVIGQIEGDDSIASMIKPEALAAAGIRHTLANYNTVLDETGVVIAGYGDDDHFPSFVSYRCSGLFLGKVLFELQWGEKIGAAGQSFVKGFAQSSMIDTFTRGVDLNLWINVNHAMTNVLHELLAKVASDYGATLSNEQREALVKESVERHGKQWLEQAHAENGGPFLRVVASLPIDEMARLAETLVSLQSLKERVTRPSESVGGPVDVAVITKFEGFVWIKRKLYFDPSLNGRYFERQRRRGDA